MNAAGFQRLEEAAREPDRNAVAAPERRSAADSYRQPPWDRVALRAGCAREQHLCRRVVADMRAGIDIARAGPAGERDTPSPAGLESGRARERRQCLVDRDRKRAG